MCARTVLPRCPDLPSRTSGVGGGVCGRFFGERCRQRPASGLRLQTLRCGDGMNEGPDDRIRLSACTPGARQLLAGWIMRVGVDTGRSVGFREVGWEPCVGLKGIGMLTGLGH